MTRALLVAGGAVALSAAGLLAFAHGKTTVRKSGGVVVQGAYCPARPAGAEQALSAPTNPELRMTAVPRTPAPIDSLAILAESLLAPAPAICRPAPDSTQRQSSIRP